ncbi:hypothetical protein SAMN04489764_0263 [Thermostaphylospora chromogena]|uniref:Uncharacterized protein n=1 Tax=Thermostaphylospora chromogena TaxID=35622 RepID=A0A1H1A1A6_9ACTN|nr:hypothetical protein SAMN04489764_0263 [Thermostaphylospora chromogena]
MCPHTPKVYTTTPEKVHFGLPYPGGDRGAPDARRARRGSRAGRTGRPDPTIGP